MLRTLDESTVYHKRVEVYRNLHNDKLSVRYKGKVVGHVDCIWLRNATFAVQPAGRDRVRREKKKNVHAFVRGKYIASDHLTQNLKVTGASAIRPNPTDYHHRVVYNPYDYDAFVSLDHPRSYAVEEATDVLVTTRGTYATGVTFGDTPKHIAYNKEFTKVEPTVFYDHRCPRCNSTEVYEILESLSPINDWEHYPENDLDMDPEYTGKFFCGNGCGDLNKNEEFVKTVSEEVA